MTGAVAVFLVALVVGSFAFIGILRNSLVTAAQSTAEQSLQAIEARVDEEGIGAIDDVDDVLVQIQDAQGRVIASGEDTSAVALPPTAGSIVRYGGEDWVLTADEVDVATDADADDDVEVTLVVGASLDEANTGTAIVTWLLVAGVPIVATLMGFVTWFVVGRALRPVDRLRGEVDDIESSRLDRRVQEPGTRDEIDRLAVTMNRMLTRLDRSQTAQRQFVSDASHELRSPLASMRQHAELAREHPEVTSLGQLTEVVVAEGVRMQSLVESLLLLTRLDERGAEHDESIDLDDIVLADASRLRALDTVTIDATGVAPGRVRGDSRLLGQVVRNLSDNAVRHARSRVTISLATVGDVVVLTVDDDGDGVDAQNRDQIFERFVRLDEGRARDAGGSGLGLAIVSATVAAHAGSVAVSESPTGGARFTVRLPTAN